MTTSIVNSNDIKLKYKVMKKSESVLKSKKFLWGAILTFTILDIIQMLLFGFGQMEMNGIWNFDDDAWKIWVANGAILVGTITGTAMFIEVANKGNKFMIYSIITGIASLIQATMFGLWYTFGKVFIVWMMRYWQKRDWESREVIETRKLNPFLFLLYFILAVGGGIGLGYLMSISGSNYDANPMLPYMDGTMLIFSIWGVYLIANRYREGYVVKFLNHVPAVAMALILHNLAGTASASLHMIMALLALMHWQMDFDVENNVKLTK
jgi:nicotinamide riboside transporter PnuC